MSDGCYKRSNRRSNGSGRNSKEGASCSSERNRRSELVHKYALQDEHDDEHDEVLLYLLSFLLLLYHLLL